ncbi:MAG: hypothetical protein RMJ88_11315 [Thermogemmata sp.]|nr:hypothetical protein [Thermogemmata sp.]
MRYLGKLRRGLLAMTVCLAGVLIGTTVAVLIGTWDQWQAWYAAYRLRTTLDDTRRLQAAERLLALGPSARPQVIQSLLHGNDAVRAALIQAWHNHIPTLPLDSVQDWLTELINAWTIADESAQQAILAWLTSTLRREADVPIPACQQLARLGLHSPYVSVRYQAVTLAVHPRLGLQAELLPLLKDAEATVRRAALFAVTATEEASLLLPDEELFHWLHDPDEGVRRICYDALVSRGRTVLEIDLGRRLTNPEAAERLKLIAELRYDEVVADPEPWLQRLVRDPEAAVRVAAVRAVAELRAAQRLLCPAWVETAIQNDPDTLARQLMRYYQQLPVRLVNGSVIPADGAPVPPR